MTNTQSASRQPSKQKDAPARLVVPPHVIDPHLVSDLLVVMMANVEDALLASGATPDLGYTRLDLLKAATPFVVSMFDKSQPPLRFAVEWPEHEHA